MEDCEIVALYWARSEDAIPETDRKYGSLCRSIARNLLDSPEDAEECVNDTWYEAWTSMPEERPENLRAWLGRVVRNISVDRFRKNRAKKRYDGMEVLLGELEDCVPATQTPEKAAEDGELREALDRWLRSLPREERILFVRRYWYGIPLKELARETGTAPGKLAQRMFRLRGKLKSALEEEGIRI